MKRLLYLVCILVPAFTCQVFAQEEPVDHRMIARIKIEGFQHSEVMEILRYLTDVAGRG